MLEFDQLYEQLDPTGSLQGLSHEDIAARLGARLGQFSLERYQAIIRWASIPFKNEIVAPKAEDKCSLDGLSSGASTNSAC